MKRSTGLLFLTAMTFICTLSIAQVNVERVEPPFWWVGMESSQLQLLIQSSDIDQETTITINHPNVKLKRMTRGDHKEFVFLDLEISPECKSGHLPIVFSTNGTKSSTLNYQLKKREPRKKVFEGIDASDAIYLITPDRFVNGDITNDSLKGLYEHVDRSFHGGRHGGDIAGISTKVDYLDDLGVTSLWISPLLENNMTSYSYHGYAITDFYNIDPRFGTNQAYKNLSSQLHSKNIKLIMDMVFNHCGITHWWMEEKPFNDWIHTADTLLTTNFEIGTLSDPYASDTDKIQMEEGWFVPSMPDLNHNNPFLANYLIQNSIWWVEYASLDGIRMDTYPYNKQEVMVSWSQRIKKEFPNLYLVGETWVGHEGLSAHWSDKGIDYTGAFNSELSGISDFPFCYAVHKAFSKEGNVRALYDMLSKDFLYYDAGANNTFIDNHDMDRVYHILSNDLSKYKQAMTFLLTTRGIPQIYYGTEILMAGSGDHGVLREDFPGGWAGDQRNAFTSAGRTAEENEAFEHVKKLLHFRKNSDALTKGKLKHFIPKDNIYVYCRNTKQESVLVVINNNDSPQNLETEKFNEVIDGISYGTDVLTGKKINLPDPIRLSPNTALVLRLERESVN